MTSEYSIAVHGMVILLHHKNEIISSARLSENICTNAARVRKVMAKLKQSCLIESTEGKGSGYKAIEGIENITLYQIQQALGEPVVSANWQSGNIDMECLIASGMGSLMDDIYSDLNDICLNRLKQITIGSLHDKIFAHNK